jgi:uncharacterized protein DUF3857
MGGILVFRRVAVSLRRIAMCVVVMVLAALWLGKREVGADEWQPIDPAELKMTSEPKAPGAPAIYLYRQVDRNDSGNATSEFNYIRIKILSEDGRKYGDVEIPFHKGSENVSGIHARTIHPDGTIVNFDGKVYEKTIVKAKGVKYLAKTFSMPDVTVGSIVEYQFHYDFNNRYFFNSRWILSAELFTRLGKFSMKPYQQPPWMVQWISPAGLPAGTEPAKEGQDSVIRLTAHDIPAFTVEDFMPPENELKFRVDFIYRDSMPEQNADKYWANYSNKEADYIEKFVNKKKAMEQAVAGIVSPSDSPEEKLRKIYTRAQQVRNLSYEESKTSEEEKRAKLKAAGNVEDVWKNGYASGGSITWLFMALARAAGFEANPVMVSARSEYFFNPNRMNSAELNANVALVKLNGKDMYCDPGTLYAPFCMLPWQESGVAGRLLDKEGGRWITTEAATSKDTKIQRAAEFNLNDQGTLDGTVKLNYTGIEAMFRRQEQRNADDAARKKYLEDQMKEYIPAAAEIELKNIPDWKSSETPLTAEFAVKIAGWVSGAGRRAMMPVGVFSASEKRVFDHADRVQPVYYPYYYMKEDDIKIELPLGWHVASVPKPQDLDAKAAEYTLKCDDQKSAVRINRTLRIDLFLVPKETYPVLRNFYQVVRTGDEEQIVLQPSGTAASN